MAGSTALPTDITDLASQPSMLRPLEIGRNENDDGVDYLSRYSSDTESVVSEIDSRYLGLDSVPHRVPSGSESGEPEHDYEKQDQSAASSVDKAVLYRTH